MGTDTGGTPCQAAMADSDEDYDDDKPTVRLPWAMFRALQGDNPDEDPNDSPKRVPPGSDLHNTPVVALPGLVRMTAADGDLEQPVGTLIRCRSRATTAALQAADEPKTPPKGQSPAGETRLAAGARTADGPRATELTARMQRVGVGLERQLQHEAARRAATRWSLLLAVAVAIGILVASMIWPA